MKQLKSISLLNHPISYQLDILEKIVENVVMDGVSIKGSCSSPQRNIETIHPQLDNTQTL